MGFLRFFLLSMLKDMGRLRHFVSQSKIFILPYAIHPFFIAMTPTQRSFLMYELIKSGYVRNKPEIKEYFKHKHGISIALKTIMRDIKRLTEKFDIPISYNPRLGKFEITDHFLQNNRLKNYFDMISFWNFTQGLEPTKNIKPYIIFDDRYSPSSKELLSPLLRAITERIKVSFVYQKFGSTQKESITLHPYNIQEYHYNWYVQGVKEAHNETVGDRIYGLDRIEPASFQILPEQSFIREERYDASG